MKPGDLFVAVAGHQGGRGAVRRRTRCTQGAVGGRGARSRWRLKVPVFTGRARARKALALIAANFYGKPGARADAARRHRHQRQDHHHLPAGGDLRGGRRGHRAASAPSSTSFAGKHARADAHHAGRARAARALPRDGGRGHRHGGDGGLLATRWRRTGCTGSPSGPRRSPTSPATTSTTTRTWRTYFQAKRKLFTREPLARRRGGGERRRHLRRAHLQRAARRRSGWRGSSRARATGRSPPPDVEYSLARHQGDAEDAGGRHPDQVAAGRAAQPGEHPRRGRDGAGRGLLAAATCRTASSA